jgi:tetratricopeptide (TPR) repeat protein
MRLPKPGFRRAGTIDQNQNSVPVNKNRRIFRQLIILLVLVLLAWGGWTLYQHHKKRSPVDESGSATLVRFLGNSKKLDDQRALSSAYLAQGNYAKAEDTMKKVVQQTNDVNDYMTLLNICAVRNVPDKKACVDLALKYIRPQIDKLPFNAVYAVGSELDEAGFGKDALPYYQQAYKIYDPAQADQYMKTKDQIKQRIDELSK